MNKTEFIAILKKGLGTVPDAADILSEYEQHFDFKLADGYSEEEISVKLGDPAVLARQFVSDGGALPGKFHKLATGVGLGLSDIFCAMLFILLSAWVAVTAAAAIALFALGVCMTANIEAALIPQMPYLSAVVFGICTIALGALCVAGTIYCLFFTRQLIRAYARWHKNTMAAASGAPVYPSVPAYPQLTASSRRHLRLLTLISLTLFGITFILGYAVSAFGAGALGFWHVWHWFV